MSSVISTAVSAIDFVRGVDGGDDDGDAGADSDSDREPKPSEPPAPPAPVPPALLLPAATVITNGEAGVAPTNTGDCDAVVVPTPPPPPKPPKPPTKDATELDREWTAGDAAGPTTPVAAVVAVAVADADAVACVEANCGGATFVWAADICR